MWLSTLILQTHYTYTERQGASPSGHEGMPLPGFTSPPVTSYLAHVDTSCKKLSLNPEVDNIPSSEFPWYPANNCHNIHHT